MVVDSASFFCSGDFSLSSSFEIVSLFYLMTTYFFNSDIQEGSKSSMATLSYPQRQNDLCCWKYCPDYGTMLTSEVEMLFRRLDSDCPSQLVTFCKERRLLRLVGVVRARLVAELRLYAMLVGWVRIVAIERNFNMIDGIIIKSFFCAIVIKQNIFFFSIFVYNNQIMND